MRIRIQTYSPLPDVKAWFVPEVHNVPESIANLKDELCRRVQALKNAQYHGRNLILLLDDFELLDDSPFSAVRDGDLICIKQLSVPEGAGVGVHAVSGLPHGQKRKRLHVSKEPKHIPSTQISVHLGRAPTETKNDVVKRLRAAHGNEYDSDTSSSSSSTSSSSSNSSTSSNSSSSSSSSSSASSSPPKLVSSKKAITKNSTIPKPTLNTTHVPPGLGKPSTHSRNKRRRKKREFMKDGVTSVAPTLKGASEANSFPLGPKKSHPSTVNPASISPPPSPPSASITQASSASPARKKARTAVEATNEDSNGSTPAPVYVTQDQVMMSSMRNKNKKKGFKLSMSNPIPQKITFGEKPPSAATQAPNETPEEQMQIDPQPRIYASTSSQSLFNSTGPAPNARLVPPSEIQARGELPSNMFVTSVDVEAGMWSEYSYAEDGNGKFDAKTKKRGKKKKVSYGDEQEQEYGDDSYYAREGVWTEANDDAAVGVLLDYSEGVGDGSTATQPNFDWDRAEKHWDSATVITSPDQLTSGVFVGWKALAINPRTFSPEVLLNVARVVEGPVAASGKGVAIRTIQRAAHNQAAFAFGLNSALDDGDGEEEEEDEDEMVEWPEVLSSEWRLLNV